MTDLDQLLRSDAQRWARDRPAIDLDRAVAAAIATAESPSRDGSDDPVSGDDLASVEERRRARRRRVRVLAPALSAAAVVIIAGSLTLAGTFGNKGKTAQQSHSSSSGRPTTGTTATSSVPVVPAGYKLVSYRDIELAVPKALAVTHSRCFPPVNAVYAPNGVAYHCAIGPLNGHKRPPPATATGVWLDQAPYGAISTNREPTGHRTAAGVRVVVRAPTRARVHAILASVRTVTVDRLGCPAHPASITPRGQPPSAELVPSRPTSAVVCELAPIGHDHTYWLVGSYRLGRATVTDLATVLDSLPTRAGTSGFGDYVWVRFGYPSGTIRVIAVPTNNEPAYISDGRRTVVDTRPGVDGLLSLLQQD
jgi:hypothetical protein